MNLQMNRSISPSVIQSVNDQIIKRNQPKSINQSIKLMDQPKADKKSKIQSINQSIIRWINLLINQLAIQSWNASNKQLLIHSVDSFSRSLNHPSYLILNHAKVLWTRVKDIFFNDTRNSGVYYRAYICQVIFIISLVDLPRSH